MSANDETAWNREEPVGGFEINSTERCWSKNPGRGGKQKTRRWQRPRTSETSSTSGTSESGRCRRRTPTPRASPTPKPTRSPSEGSVTSEWSETSVSSVGSWTRSFSAMKRWFALQTEDEMRFRDDQSKEHHHEGANLDLSCRSGKSCFQETLHDEWVIAVREELSLHMEHQREVNRNWKSEVRPARRGEWRLEDGSMRVDVQRRDQRPERFHDFSRTR